MSFKRLEQSVGINRDDNTEVESFEDKAEKLHEALLAELEELYPESQFEYHNMLHSKGVGDKAVAMLSIERREAALTRLIGYAHDYNQEYQDPWPGRGEGKVGFKRVRKTGDIEEKSLAVLLQKCEEAGIELTDSEKNIATEAIRATIPGWDNELSTVTQPSLKAGAHNITFAIAAADLGSAGYDPDHFLQDGDNVFNEDNLLPAPETLTDAEAEQLLQEVLGWTALQIQYVGGQKQLWSRDFIPDFLKKSLVGFDESKEKCITRYVRRVAFTHPNQGGSPQERLRFLLDDMKFKRYIK